ncbi:MAG: XdhC family protein [Rhodospirillales bacterium]|nr:XdhC family protein [Rhodospirillales bacterium]
MEDGKPRILEFGVSDEQAWEVGLACGGDIRVHVARAPEAEILSRLVDERPIAQITDLDTGETCLVTGGEQSGGLKLGDEDLETVRNALRDDKSRSLKTGTQGAFVKVHNPPQRLFLIGAVHISQALVPMAQLAGFHVTVIDPRGPFATEARFPDVDLTEDWPDEALERLKIDSRSAVVALTHDPKFDDPGLAQALRSDAFYIGALGSRKTQASRRERLDELGFGEEDFKRINGPVGLDLGATSPAEIAVSVLAEMVAAKHGKSFK